MSTTLKQTPPCPTCGQAMPAGALAGLCPACLLAQGAETDTGGTGPKVRFEPPSVAAMAKLFPQLEILGLLGAGGMGAVYQARQPALDRWVALKVLPAGGAHGTDFAERFNREARALARLSHPHIVAVHEFGQVEGLHFFLMEFVDGTNLRQLEQAGRLSPREALQLIPQLCDALQYAHDEGVVHRDIKPENVLVDRKGRVKIADFGLAKIMGQDPDGHRLTVEGQVMGTPHYMAPEQVARPLSVDHRADIYSLGVVFYELLTGELPLGKFLPPSRKVQVDVRLDDIVLRALENDPARRYQHASEVKSGVETVTNSPGLASIAPEASAPSSPVRCEEPARVTNRAATSWWRAITPGLAGFAVWLLVVVTTAFVTASLPQMFKATARVRIGPRPDTNGIAQAALFDPFLSQSVIEHFLSFAILERAAERLKLQNWQAGWEAGWKIGGQLSPSDAAVLLRSATTVRQFSNTEIFEVECRSRSAADVANMANAVVTAFEDYLEWLRDQPTSVVRVSTARLWKAEMVGRAVTPLRASSPNVPLNTFLGLVIGGVSGGAAALLVGWIRRRAGVAGTVDDQRRSRFVVGAAVAVVIGIPFVVVLNTVRAALQAERQRALAVEKALALTTAQKAETVTTPADDAAQTVAGLPPVVVETQPMSGARDVAPGVVELRARFSKEMAAGSWSWAEAWADSTPELIGPPRYEADRRTCVATAKLEPGRTYAFWLNSDKFQNFTDPAGRPALPYLLIFQTAKN